MVMLEDNPYSSIQYFAAQSDLDSGGGQDRGLEDRDRGKAKTRGKDIFDTATGLDVGSGHHGPEDGGQSAPVRGNVKRQRQDGDKQQD